jgi:Protein of unknown function (DUF2934)
MLPTRDQIERAAYDRWIRRHRAHGYDRDDWIGSEIELTYLLNYQTVVEFPLDLAGPLNLGNDPVRGCRLCERGARHTAFSAPRPVVQGLPQALLHSNRVCDECQADCRDALAVHCENFWRTLHASGDAYQVVLRRDVDSLAVFKSLVASALLVMPETELAYFPDTLEWVNNPDHEYDGGLFAGSYCHIYRDPSPPERSWISLARRVDDEAPFPYMAAFISWAGVVVQISVPMSVRDQDLDGRNTRLLQRSLVSGDGPHFRVIRPTVLQLVNPASRRRPMNRHVLVA